MENEYLADGGLNIIFYIAIAVAGWIWKLYKKNQEKEKENEQGNFYEEPKEETYQSPSRSFEDVLENFAGQLKTELRTTSQPNVGIEEEPMVNSLSELQEKYGADKIVKEKKTNRFEEYKIEEEKKNIFADLLDDKENFTKAFVLSQILERKEY